MMARLLDQNSATRREVRQLLILPRVYAHLGTENLIEKRSRRFLLGAQLTLQHLEGRTMGSRQGKC